MKKILIVEDELPIAELEKDYLELSDFEVTIECFRDRTDSKFAANTEKSIWHLSLLFRQKRKILIKSMD